MKRLGNFLTILTISCLVLVTARAIGNADPTWAPTLKLPNDTTIQFCEMDSVCYNIEATDPDYGDSLFLTLLEGGIDYPPTMFPRVFTENVCFYPDTSGQYRFIWEVRDKQGHIVKDTVTYSVTVDNPPTIADQSFSKEFCYFPGPRTLTVYASDPDGGPLTYELVSGPGSIDPTTGAISYVPDTAGVYAFAVAVTDMCASDTAAILDSISINMPPSLQQRNFSFDMCAPQEICIDLVALDPENGPVTITQIEGSGQTTMLTENSAQLCFTPDNVDSSTYMFVYCLTDVCPLGSGAGLAAIESPPCFRDTVWVTVKTNQPPVIVCPEAQTFYTCVTDTFCFGVEATDPESGPLVFRVLSGNATIEGTTVCVVGSESSQFDVVLEVADECENADTCVVPVTVNGNRPPIVTMPADSTISLCQAETVCLDVSADDPDFDLSTVTVNIGTYDPQTNQVCFDVDTSGIYTVVLIATDSCGESDSDTTVVSAVVNGEPTVDLGPDFDTVLCEPGTICFEAALFDDNVQTFYLSYGLYDSASGRICLTPDTSGTYTIVGGIVDDCGLVAEDTVTIGLQLRSPPVISGFGDTSIYICNPQYVCLPVTISDPDNDISGITVNRGSYEDGAVCFVPYTEGQYKIVLTVTDSCGNIVADTALVDVATDEAIVLQCPGDTTIFLCEPDTLCFPVGGIPEDATVSVSGTAAWWDAESQTVCFYSDCCVENKLTVSATTACGTYSCSFTVTVQTNSKPMVILPQDTSVQFCGSEQLCLPVGINDIDNNLADVQVTGATYDSYRGVLCFMPDSAGTYVVSVRATDDCGAVDEDQMIVRVAFNEPPILSYSPADTIYRQCEPAEICVPFGISDSDNNIVTITSSAGQITGDGDSRTLCFTPSAFGDYCVSVVATDACGAADTINVCVTVIAGEQVAIECPEPSPVQLCKPDSVCLPVAISGQNYEVTASFGAFSEGNLCFFADSSGLYNITIIAQAECNADTCVLSIPVGIAEPPAVTCPNDTTIFLCATDTVELPYSVSGSVYSVQVTSPAFLEGDRLLVPVLNEDEMMISLVAVGECAADTCSFKVIGRFNQPPIVEIRDTSIILCELDEICVPYEITDADGNVVAMSSSTGTLDQGLLCFIPDHYGDYSITVTATDACGAEDTDLVLVSVAQGDFVSIDCPGSQIGTLCGSSELCFPLDITGTNFQVLTSFGEYRDGNICFSADTTGHYVIRVIAEAGCASDTCDMQFDITVVNPITMTCNVPDTSVFLCDGPDTVSFPVPITGDNIQISTQPSGTYYQDGRVYVPILVTGGIDVTVVAKNECSADTCSFAIDAEINEPPVLVAPADTSLTACELSTICLPFSVSDVNNNIVEVRATLGIINDTILCFTPANFGDYTIILSASDSCGVTVKDTVKISIAEGEFAVIECPASVIPVSIETPDTVRVPIGITPAGATVTVSPFGYYDHQTGEVVAYIESPGQHTFQLIAEASCNVDTCQFTIDVSQYFPPTVICTGSVDTVLCLTSPATLCLPVTVTGTNAQVIVAPVGDYADGVVCVPVDTSGDYVMQIIAFNDISADTCYSTITVQAGDPPQLALPDDFATALCEPGQECFPLTITGGDFGIDQLALNYGTYNESTGEICIDIDSSGTYMIVVSIVDSCGLTDADTILVSADLNDLPIVDLGDDRAVRLCDMAEVCVDVSVTDDNLVSVTTNLGQYDSATGQVCFVPEVASLYRLIVTATDECGISVTDSVDLTVDLNRSPLIDRPMVDTSVYICRPQYICLPVGFSDPDNNIASISVNRGRYENGAVCFVPYDSGQYRIILTITDSCGAGVLDTAIVTVHTDQAISLVCPNDTSLFLCEPDTLCFPVTGVPEGATVKVGGTASWWDAENQTVCFFSDCCVDNKITVQVTSACGTVFTCSFNVHVQTNSKPLVILPQDTSLTQCQPAQVCIPVGVNDIDHNLESVVVEGATYDSYRHQACFTPDTAGNYTISVTATDSCGAVDMDQMVVQVVENRDPEVTFTAADSVFFECEFAQICLPVQITDLDNNITQITVSHGAYDAENSQVCFLPDSFGVYCITVTAVDECNRSASDIYCVRVAPGDYVTIECPANPLDTSKLCGAGQVCVPLVITGTSFDVGSSLGEWVDGSLCFQADTSGLYAITVTAAAQCGTDTCVVQVPVEILGPAAVTCPGNQDVFLCEPDTLCYDFTVSPSVTNITVSAPAYISGSTLCVPMLKEDSLNIMVVAQSDCGADSCDFYVKAGYNAAPVVSAGPDISRTECTLSEVCIPIQVSDADGNVASVTSSLGAVNDQHTQVCFTPAQFGVYQIVVTATDECDAADVDTVVVTITEGTVASILCPEDDQFASLCHPDTVCIVAPIMPSNATVTILPNGRYHPQTGEICIYASQSGTIPVKVIASAACGSDTCEFNLQVEMGTPPSVTCPATIDTTLCLATPNTFCFPVTVTGTGVQVTVKPAGQYAAGFVCVPITSAGNYAVQVIASGVCGADTCTTNISVDADQPPQLFLPETLTFERCPGDTELICIDGIYAGDAENAVTLTKICGPGDLDLVSSDSGEICFLPEIFGSYQFCVEASDGCQAVTDTFLVNVNLRTDCDVCLRASIDGGACTPVGLRKVVAINVEANDALAGFDILISYDASALSFVNATTEGTVIEAYEYFMYNLSNGSCGGSCPSGIVRLVGIADINNGAAHPPASVYHPQGPIVFIEFQVANDQNLGSQFLPISFVWYDCGDNTFSDPTGSVLYTDLRIFNAEGGLVWDETDDVHYPSSARPFGVGAPDACMIGTEKGQPLRCIEFYNGGICVTPPSELDDRGDINLDGLAYTIADAVLFTNYFIYGFSAFTINIAGQTAATDVNADGITLSVSDLVYLIRVVVGDADPVPKPVPYPEELLVSTTVENGVIGITTEAVENIGAAYFVYDLDRDVRIDVPRLTAASGDMDVKYSIENGQLRVLVYNVGSGRIEAGRNRIIDLPFTGDGSIRLVKADIADFTGRPYKTSDVNATVPGGYTLNQNYPNPFNPSTNISFTLPQASDWTLSVFNIKGELVRRYSGTDGAGEVVVTWDGVSSRGEQVASGIYLYRLEAGTFNETRKMMLIK